MPGSMREKTKHKLAHEDAGQLNEGRYEGSGEQKKGPM